MVRVRDLVRLVLLLDVILVAAYTRPVAAVMHNHLYLKKRSSADIQSPALAPSEREVMNASSYEMARNERLLFDKDVAMPIDVIRSEKRQIMKRPSSFAIVQRSLELYQKVYGDMLVPISFVVPENVPDWPEEIWGMHLGMVVKNIRNGTFYKSKRDELRKIGFDFCPVPAKYDTVIIALLKYEQLYGDMLVPYKFVVPTESGTWPEETWNINLGALVSNIRSGSSYADKRDELISLGFYFNTRKARFDLVKVAIKKYIEIHGNARVPQSFTVPREIDPLWPKGMWGINLGAIVHSIRGGKRFADKKQELRAIGFDYNAQKTRQYGYSLTRNALLRYQKTSEHGDMQVPYNFQIPENSNDWPQTMWGMKLGIAVNNIKGGNYAANRDDLIGIGFSYDAFQSKYQIVRTALRTYKAIHGDMLVPRKYIIPDQNSSWPKECWTMKLGTVVYNIRAGSSYADQKDDLIGIGFNFDALAERWNIIKTALLRYKALNGDMLVGKNFIVPKEDDWPVELWGMQLGIAVRNMRSRKGSFADKREELLKMGFVYTTQKRFDYDCVRIALFKYRELYHGSVRVPSVYNIPKNDPWYPEETWGMCLGSMVTRIKQGDKWPEKRYELLGDY